MDYYKIISQFYFTDYLGIAINIVAFIIGLTRYKESKELRIITYYLGVSIVNSIIGSYFELFQNNLFVGQATAGILSVTEFVIFCSYLYKTITSRKMRLVIKFFYWTFPAFLFWGWIKIKQIGIPGEVYVLDAFYMISPCLVYFYELFNTEKIVPLKNLPPFWIITGILFYNACSLPIFLLEGYFIKNSLLYSDITFTINYMLYNILYLLFIKAYLCKRILH